MQLVHGIEPFTAARGHEVIERLGPAQMEARYLALADGTIAGNMPAFFSLEHARTIA